MDTMLIAPRTDASRFPSTRLDASRCFVPLLPDLRFEREWSETVAQYGQRFGVLPQVFRATQLAPNRIVICELLTDAAGYGQVRVAGELRVEEFHRAAPQLLGRFGRMIVDAALADQMPEAVHLIRDTELQEATWDRSSLHWGMGVDAWRQALAVGLDESRPLRVRAALERVRMEMAAWLELLLQVA